MDLEEHKELHMKPLGKRRKMEKVRGLTLMKKDWNVKQTQSGGSVGRAGAHGSPRALTYGIARTLPVRSPRGEL